MKGIINSVNVEENEVIKEHVDTTKDYFYISKIIIVVKMPVVMMLVALKWNCSLFPFDLDSSFSFLTSTVLLFYTFLLE